jgi:CelD/BcsL family acetyltransferase involved in cellulose biosynthesis
MLISNTADAALDPRLRSDAAPAPARGEIAAEVANRIEDVEAVWRDLTAGSIESPGQSYDFIRLWVADRKVPQADQRYVVGRIDGQAVALLPLHRKFSPGSPAPMPAATRRLRIMPGWPRLASRGGASYGPR